MARPKEFKQDKALHRAIRLFSQQGFAGTSTEELMRVMDIGRQSMYDTFGDKRALFLRALETYVTESVNSLKIILEEPGPALAAIQATLISFAARKDLTSSNGCMGLNALCEFGQRDEDVNGILREAGQRQRHALRDALIRAKAERELDPDADLDSMEDFFESTLAGIRMAAKGGKSRQALHNIATLAARVYAPSHPGKR